jgi:hypothetical protein
MATLKTCRGLITFQNELDRPEGALEIADNVVIDRENTIEPRRGFDDFGTASTNLLKQQFIYKNRIFRHYDTTIEFDSDGAGTFTTLNGSFSETETDLRIKSQETKGNLFFTTNAGVQKISAASVEDLSPSNVRDAGGVKAVDINASLVPTVGGFLPPQSKCAYRLVWGVRDANGNLILGSPSSRFVLTNTAKDQTFNEEFTIDFSDPSDVTPANINGKYILFSSENTDYFMWWNTSTTEQPATAETVNRTPIEVDLSAVSGTAQSIADATGNTLGANVSTEFEVSIGTKTVTLLSKEVGVDLSNASEETGGITNVSVSIDVEGSTLSASSANTELNFTVPSDVDSTDFFYQIYRTANFTVTEVLTLDDIDPCDEMNLVLEDNVTNA